MEKQCLRMFVRYLSFLVLLCSCGHCQAMESPQYTVVRSASNVEIRLYRESLWMSALVRSGATFSSFNYSTGEGFHRLYQYIHGGNTNSSQISITAPILTTISHGSDYIVRIYLPAKYMASPPQPNTQLNLQFDKWKSHCIAVRKFSGFAGDDNIKKEREALMSSLDEMESTEKSVAVLEDKISYSVAQYNASFHLSGRLNEVWINVLGFMADGCPTYGSK
ncbi:hypothetical protein LguiA_000214 [Lonicera macranthoides]